MLVMWWYKDWYLIGMDFFWLAALRHSSCTRLVIEAKLKGGIALIQNFGHETCVCWQGASYESSNNIRHFAVSVVLHSYMICLNSCIIQYMYMYTHVYIYTYVFWLFDLERYLSWFDCSALVWLELAYVHVFTVAFPNLYLLLSQTVIWHWRDSGWITVNSHDRLWFKKVL